MNLTKILRNGVAGTLIALLPVTSSIAATRPSAAVPMASSAASTAALDDDGDGSIGWVGIALGVAAIAIFAILVLDDDDDDSVSEG